VIITPGLGQVLNLDFTIHNLAPQTVTFCAKRSAKSRQLAMQLSWALGVIRRSIMYDNPELHVSSAKQLMELNKQRDKETRRMRETEQQARQLESEKIALLRESNELAKNALREVNQNTQKNNADLVDIKPNFFGLGANLNEAWRRFMKWRSK
jgi:septal ring factor EnvC (AmiA/AmiB activator)